MVKMAAWRPVKIAAAAISRATAGVWGEISETGCTSGRCREGGVRRRDKGRENEVERQEGCVGGNILNSPLPCPPPIHIHILPFSSMFHEKHTSGTCHFKESLKNLCGVESYKHR